MKKKAYLHWFLPLIPMAVLIHTGLKGIDFGEHWDEPRYQLGYIEKALERETLLPDTYIYPSFNLFIGVAALVPELFEAKRTTSKQGKDFGWVKRFLLAKVKTQEYRLRFRKYCLFLSSLAILWVYITVWVWRRSSVEAFVASCLLAFSWEVAYHLRFIAVDGPLMQFAALCFMGCVLSIYHRAGRYWLYLAAMAAGLGCGAKYPGGLLLLPVLFAAWNFNRNRDAHVSLLGLFAKLSLIFGVSYILTTPGTYVQPTKFIHWVTYISNHYGGGEHGGYNTVSHFEYAWKSLGYIVFALLSHQSWLACLCFLLGLSGLYFVTKENTLLGIGFGLFGFLYYVYFCTVNILLVRNYLILVPLFAVFGARALSEWHRLLPKPVFRHTLKVLVAGLFTYHAGYLFFAAQTIADRYTLRPLNETLEYVKQNTEKVFYLSPQVRQALGRNELLPSENVTRRLEQADSIVFMLTDISDVWEWPANLHSQFETWFGPHDANLNYYPTWPGKEHIVVMKRTQFIENGLFFLPPVSPSLAVQTG